MSNYRRWYVAGGTYFFTLVSYRRHHLFSDEVARNLLGDAIREIAAVLPFTTVATVLLPDHMHCVWTLPPGHANYSIRWKDIKSLFTTRWFESGGRERPVTSAQAARGNRGIWQKRFWEHVVDTDEELERVCDYIHYNPVKHGYVKRPADWPWSSFHRFVREGQYSMDWGRSEPLSVRGMEKYLRDV
jgi:putative transposase